MKLLSAFKKQIDQLQGIRRVWLTTFTLDLNLVETYLLPTVLGMERPRNRMDYENFQVALVEAGIDFRVFCDKRMLEPDQYKRTAIAVHPISPRGFADVPWVSDETLFHPKVIFLEDLKGAMVLGVGSANLSVSGWGRNQEVFTFHRVSNNAQYQQIKTFFGPLSQQLGLELEFARRTKFADQDHAWQFVHSFAQRSFLQQLMGQATVASLAVWSPYLSADLPGLLDELRTVFGNQALQVALVADRLQGRFFRSPWSVRLQTCLEQGDLAFHASDYPAHEHSEMTHAKLWLAKSPQGNRLAIGSWNFTHSGTSSLERRNIEAGIVLDAPASLEIVGRKLVVSAADFASAPLLQEQSLTLADELPFDVQVHFDWQTVTYAVTGYWHNGQPDAEYQLKLPGVAAPFVLAWKSRRSGGFYPLQAVTHAVADNEALLADHSYAVHYQGQVVYRGLIVESGQSHRRAQGFDSLKDLLDNLLSQVDPRTCDAVLLRECLRTGTGPDEEPPAPLLAVEQDALSYFRLFQAIEQFRQRLDEVPDAEQLHLWLFSYPGCLQELAGKTRRQLQGGAPSVFNWFLAQEVNSLYAQALQRFEDFRLPYARRQPPEERWSTLRVPLPLLPPALAQHPDYLRSVEQECNYEQQ